MFKHYSRLGGIALSCLFAASWSHDASASNQLAPEMAATSATVTSPTVSFGTLPALQVATPKPGSKYVPGDFNGDGTSDLLWFNPILSQVGYWTMNATTVGVPFSGGGVTRTGLASFAVTPGYFVGAVGDFNNDGYADLVFTSANHDLWLWTNNRNGSWSSTKIGTYPSQWQLVGAGDIDGDGYDDLLWLDPSECKFGYWTMHGAVPTGYQIIDIACGYYPIGIGYYQPSNRLSILWTSAANDLYIWDSKPGWFASYNLTSAVGNLTSIWAMGGGYMGSGMGIQYYQASVGSPGGIATGGIFSRIFDARGNQTGFQGGTGWDGGAFPLGSGGYVIQGNGVNATGLYSIDQANTTISTNGLPGSDLLFSGNGGIMPGRDSWTYPVGWWLVGAPANGTANPANW
ncbi:FG-GAP repeat domain-containing protein [Dyella silvae]|uniref:FG-GAP repeat domain-containing protein n=1 Tax=Dyella silvae TaxID=2994424 RepID=UPI002265114C|nr:VCBS repeat-containing protein [Dyella silvae]